MPTIAPTPTPFPTTAPSLRYSPGTSSALAALAAPAAPAAEEDTGEDALWLADFHHENAVVHEWDGELPLIVSPGKEAEYVKVSFHVAVAGNANGLGDWLKELNAKGIPFFLKSADSAGPLLEAERLSEASGVPTPFRDYKEISRFLDSLCVTCPIFLQKQKFKTEPHEHIYAAKIQADIPQKQHWLSRIGVIETGQSYLNQQEIVVKTAYFTPPITALLLLHY